MTVYEILTFFEVYDKKAKEDIEQEANIIRIAVSSAMSGKPIKLFEEEKAKAKKNISKNRAEEFKALNDLGI